MKVNIIAITQSEGFKLGEIIDTREIPLAEAKTYFKRVSLQRHKPSTRIMVPTEDSGYGLDVLGLLVENGKFTFNKFGQRVMKESSKATKEPKK